MLEVYREFAEDVLAMPVIAGEKPENERFPGAVQHLFHRSDDAGRQGAAGRHLALPRHQFRRGAEHPLPDDKGGWALCHTTSWGVSTRLIGGVIMTHGDDDGLRLPPAIAPRQIVVVPMLRDKPEDAEVLAYCEALVDGAERAERASASRCAPCSTRRRSRSAEKRWNWVRRGAPVIVEIGPRDAAGGQVTFMRRDALRDGDKVKSHNAAARRLHRRRAGAAGRDPEGAVRRGQGAARRQHPRRHHRLRRPRALFRPGRRRRGGRGLQGLGARGLVASPTGAALDEVEQRLKALKLTIRNAPLDQPAGDFGACLFTGAARASSKSSSRGPTDGARPPSRSADRRAAFSAWERTLAGALPARQAQARRRGADLRHLVRRHHARGDGADHHHVGDERLSHRAARPHPRLQRPRLCRRPGHQRPWPRAT